MTALKSRSDNLRRLAGEYDLRLNYVKEFHEVFSENSDHPDFGPLLQHMKVVDANGESQMDEDQWEAASAFTQISLYPRFNGPMQISTLPLPSRRPSRTHDNAPYHTKRFTTVLLTMLFWGIHVRNVVHEPYSMFAPPNIPMFAGGAAVVYANVPVYDTSFV